MKKYIVSFFLLISSFSSLSLARSFQVISYLKEGSCYHILNHIQKQTQNDSLAVEYLKDYYKINSLSPEQTSKLFEKRTSEIFDYFKSNQHLKCYLKRLKKDPVLLDDRRK